MSKSILPCGCVMKGGQVTQPCAAHAEYVHEAWAREARESDPPKRRSKDK